MWRLQGISEGEDVEALVKQQEGEVAALEATLEAEETRHMAEISKKLDEEHKENVHQAYRALFDKVRFLVASCYIVVNLNFPKSV